MFGLFWTWHHRSPADLADEAAELRRRLDAQEHLSEEHASAYEAADTAAASVLDAVAERVEALAAGVERAAQDLTK